MSLTLMLIFCLAVRVLFGDSSASVDNDDDVTRGEKRVWIPPHLPHPLLLSCVPPPLVLHCTASDRIRPLKQGQPLSPQLRKGGKQQSSRRLNQTDTKEDAGTE